MIYHDWHQILDKEQLVTTRSSCPTDVSTYLKHHFQPWFKAERGLESFMTRDVRGGLLTYFSLEDMADLPKWKGTVRILVILRYEIP